MLTITRRLFSAALMVLALAGCTSAHPDMICFAGTTRSGVPVMVCMPVEEADPSGPSQSQPEASQTRPRWTPVARPVQT